MGNSRDRCDHRGQTRGYEEYRQTFESKIDKVRDIVEQQGIHVAMGGSFAQFGDKDYNSRKMEADKRMYDEKRRFYRDANDRRGRQGLSDDVRP